MKSDNSRGFHPHRSRAARRSPPGFRSSSAWLSAAVSAACPPRSVCLPAQQKRCSFLIIISFISFNFSNHVISVRFISFYFISFKLISFHFISFHFISFHFTSFHSIPFHFIFILSRFISFRFNSFHPIPFIFMSFPFSTKDDKHNAHNPPK